MKYDHVVRGIFRKRKNRFIAEVSIGGVIESVHVKNTGRLINLLKEGNEVLLEQSFHPNRKTKYSLIGARKGDRWVNIDSQAPNQVVFDSLRENRIPEFAPFHIHFLKRESSFGHSRFDLYFEGKKGKGFIEVKGVTLEQEGIALFPDAPTERGRKHLLELMDVVQTGYTATVFFLVQMEGCRGFRAHRSMDEGFAAALSAAHKAGVHVLVYDALVRADEIVLGRRIPWLDQDLSQKDSVGPDEAEFQTPSF
jgi:sugar fermentation stimulation protein